MPFFRGRIAQAQESANFVAQGTRHSTLTEYKGLSTIALAQIVAFRELKVASYPIAKFHLRINRKGFSFRMGAVFLLTFRPTEPRGFTKMPVRISQINYGKLDDGVIELDVVEDIFGIIFTGYAVPGDTGWTEPNTSPDKPVAILAIEAPYAMVINAERRIFVGLVRGDFVTTGFQAWADESGGFVPSLFNEIDGVMPSGLLTADYSRKSDALDAVGFTLDNAHDLDTLETVISSEMLRGHTLGIFADTGEFFAWTETIDNGDDTFSFTGILRGVLDTVPKDHPAGTRVYFFDNGFGSLRLQPYAADIGPVEIWLTPRTASEAFPPSAILPQAITTASRALKPYPPGKVQVNGFYWPESTVGDAVLTLAHRNRLTQTDLVPQSNADFGTPEGTYQVKVILDGSEVQDLSSGDDTSYTYTAIQRVTDDTDGLKLVQFEITPENSPYEGTVRTTDSFMMTGLGLAMGLVLGGQNV